MRIPFLERERDPDNGGKNRIGDTFLHAEINEETVRFNAP